VEEEGSFILLPKLPTLLATRIPTQAKEAKILKCPIDSDVV
jgi:hypothetical protein